MSWLLDVLEFHRNFGALRSSDWPTVRKTHLSLHPVCEVCGAKNKLLKPLQVHHCQPFHLKPELELDPQNLITLCPDHHIFIGHLMNFKSFNPLVREDSKLWNEKIKSRA